MSLAARYRALGADPPFGDPRRPHGVPMEGWFWRITHAASGTVAIVLLSVNRDGRGGTWGTVGLAAHPGGFSRSAATAHARADRLTVVAGDDGRPVADTGPGHVRVELGGDARLDIRLEERCGWPAGRMWGGLGPAQAIPGLSQYWHPWLFGARVSGTLRAGGREVDLEGATAYAEKNWGRGFPSAWWWGQAHGFERDDVCVSFAGGRAGIGPLRTIGTAVVVRAGDRLVRVVRPLQPLRVAVDEHGWRLRAPGIELEGHANGTPSHRLPIPIPAERRNEPGAAAQHLAGEVRLRLTRRGRTLFEGVSVLAGLERGGAPPAGPPRPGPRLR